MVCKIVKMSEIFTYLLDLDDVDDNEMIMAKRIVEMVLVMMMIIGWCGDGPSQLLMTLNL